MKIVAELTIRVEYDASEVTGHDGQPSLARARSEILSQLDSVATLASGEGMLSGNTALEVDLWSSSAKIITVAGV